MNIVLWILQVLLALQFGLHGQMMISPPAALLDGSRKGMQYVAAIPIDLRRFIGVAEILGAIGLILPVLTNILPWLTPLAAIGFMIDMLSAIVFHIRRHETPNIVYNVMLLIMAAIVAYGRLVIVPV
jgi:putative oxidoreductase